MFTAPAWSNWSGSVHSAPQGIFHPTTQEEVVAVINSAVANGQQIRAVGSGHSHTPLAATDGTMVSLEHLNKLESLSTTRYTATAQAGITLHDLGKELFKHGFTLRNLGDIDKQSLGGALATGTHGTGLKLSSLSTHIIGFTEQIIGSVIFGKDGG